MVFYSAFSSLVGWVSLASGVAYVASSACGFVLSKGFNLVWYKVLGNETDKQKQVKAIKYEVDKSNKVLIDELRQTMEEERDIMREQLHNELEEYIERMRKLQTGEESQVRKDIFAITEGEEPKLLEQVQVKRDHLT